MWSVISFIVRMMAIAVFAPFVVIVYVLERLRQARGNRS